MSSEEKSESAIEVIENLSKSVEEAEEFLHKHGIDDVSAVECDPALFETDGRKGLFINRLSRTSV